MDEVLRRRLVGASVLLAAAFVVSTLLPDAGPHPGRASERVVTYDLRTGQPIDRPEATKPAPTPASAPVGSPAPSTAVAAAPEAKSRTQAPAIGANTTPARTEEPKPVMPKAAAPAPSKPTAAPSAPHPVLKVDETFGEKPKTATAAAKGQWFVQIGSFASEGNAQKVMKKLLDERLPALTQIVPQDKKLWYRVRVGPYAAESAATKALGSVRAQGFKQAKLVKLDNGGPATGGN